MQSYRQYQQIRRAIQRTVRAGHVLNSPTDRANVLDEDHDESAGIETKTPGSSSDEERKAAEEDDESIILRFKAELELQGSLLQRFQSNVVRAVHMVTKEPTVALLGSWLVLEYIAVFGLLQGFSYIFGDTHGFERGSIGTSFVTIAIGAAIWTAAVAELHERVTGRERSRSLMQKANAPGTDLPDPEYRLWSALLDTYGIYAGSALAMVTCWRYGVSGLINLVSRPMHNGIGVHWTMTLMGCIAVLPCPLPLIFFYKYGPQMRARSRFAGKYSRPQNKRGRTGRALSWR
ncbi:hypothetical protein EJ03DRAFT_377141 [Teratosphaeria nubilosa]|uniref:Uncharacterized protein n=1 Tax=Teratosphaeria nubilosa TaxID=161662 RepID=A0A6G1L0Z5_9PEZI|nr:hypothetical protein EJ03DRAFT_377141 [Teratosphaeria nubilosa]